MISTAIQQLVNYGLDTGLILPDDEIYIRNQLLMTMQLDSFTEPEGDVCYADLESILKTLVDDAVARGVCDDSPTARDLFDTRLMGVLTPRPSIVRANFEERYETDGPQAATDWFYKFSQDTDYIRRYRIKRDVKWVTKTPYGDLDISILDELPPGRKPVKTRCITGKKRADLYGFLDREIDSGRQAYIVCPAIEDAGGSGLNAVKSYYEDIAKAYLPDRRVGLMHGKLKPKEKAEVMDDFKSGRLDALVSTTVIEVGVDVPNATVMVIENAERYGLSALHQLRGRVGRGAAESWCFLVSDNASESVQKRLKFLCSTSDGFAVAQYDLETRGPGDFFGSRQHGLPTLQIADLMNDTRTLHAAQSEAAALLAEDPLLERPEHALLARQVEQMFDKAGAMN